MELEFATLHAAHGAHLNARRRFRLSTATIEGYEIYVGGFIRYLEELQQPLGLQSLNIDLVGDYQDWLRGRSMGSRDGAAAEHQAVRMLKTFARWLWRRGFVPIDPLARLETPRLAKIHREPFTESEVRRLVDAARAGRRPVFQRALLLLGLDTGARIGELCAAELGDLDLERGRIVFRHTKFRRTRSVFFTVPEAADGGPCARALREWLIERGELETSTIFTNKRGEPLNADTARRIYKRLGKAARVADCIPHRGRHTHATEFLAEAPGAELHLRHRLGHLSQDVLADYVMISDRSAHSMAAIASLSAKWNL